MSARWEAVNRSHRPCASREAGPAAAVQISSWKFCTPASVRLGNSGTSGLRLTDLYTDFFLSKVIDFLGRSEAKYDTAMLYVSDHGESLGDNGFWNTIPTFARSKFKSCSEE